MIEDRAFFALLIMLIFALALFFYGFQKDRDDQFVDAVRQLKQIEDEDKKARGE